MMFDITKHLSLEVTLEAREMGLGLGQVTK